MPQRNYRDPVHNIISLDESAREDKLIVDLIDSAELQRLRRIKQLGLGLYTYQGAEHSRFTHSLGALHLMTRVLARLSETYSIDPADRIAARAAALLHDVGHGSFSHVMEKMLNFHHERWTVQVILDQQSEIGELLRSHSSDLPFKVASIIEGTFQPSALAQLVSSQLDVDRMDYLLRDSLMTGAKYGIYDLEWIINALAIDEEADRVYVQARGIYAVEEYLQARYYMFRQVYFHRTLRSAEAVLRSIIRRALKLLDDSRYVWHAAGTAFEKILRREKLTINEHLQIDDSDFVFHIKQWQNSSDPILSDQRPQLGHDPRVDRVLDRRDPPLGFSGQFHDARGRAGGRRGLRLARGLRLRNGEGGTQNAHLRGEWLCFTADQGDQRSQRRSQRTTARL